MEPDRFSEIEKLFNQALDRDPEQRSDFLAQACPDDQVRREVESLIAHRQEGDQLLENRPAKTVPIESLGGQIGVYRLEAMLGEGGMGVVYRALDTKLNRPVAVKVLSDELAGPAARRRFQREAQMASALNHPHILTVHDAGEIDGRQYLVTEFVDGGTLKDWARTSKRSWREIVELLIGAADGLACAHKAGILHRDIKPENIFVSKSGYAKLADFGLAKLLETEAAEAETLTAAVTRPGMILGTVAYMSPEQAAGRPVDARSDIFSFGLMMYEMLTGRRAFEGATNLEVLQKIIHAEAEPLPDDLPVGLRMAIGKALEKQPADRYQSTQDLVVDLRRLIREPTQSPALTTAQRPHGRQSVFARRAALGLVAFALVVGGAVFFLRSRQPSAPSQLQYTQITNFTDSANAPALSPDGRMVAFIRGGQYFQSHGQIYVKVLPDGESVQLTNEPDLKYAPIFTPDGSRVAYTLLKPGGSWDTWTVPVLGGQPTRLLPNASGLSWIDSRRILFSEIMSGTGTHMGIVTSGEDRSGERSLYFPAHERAMAHYSYASPDHKWALVVEMDRTTAWQSCRLVSLEGSETRQVGPQGGCLAAGWSPDGEWMYFDAEVDGAWHLWRQHFPQGVPQQLTFGPSEEEGIAVSPDGRSLMTSAGKRSSTIWIHDAGGDRAISAEAFAFKPRMSVDGTRIFYLLRQSPGALSSQSVASLRSSPFGANGGALRSTDIASGKSDPLLPDLQVLDYSISRDGKEVVFTTASNGELEIWLAPLDRHTSPSLLTKGKGGWFGRDNEILFTQAEGEKIYLYRINRDGSGRERITSTPVLAVFGGVSADGEWLPILAPATGSETNWETVAVQIHGGGSRKICAFFCGARWSNDGAFLYLDTDISGSSPTGKTFAIPIQPGKPFGNLPATGITSPADIAKLSGARVIERSAISPGPDRSTYVFVKQGFDGNLFRVDLPR